MRGRGKRKGKLRKLTRAGGRVEGGGSTCEGVEEAAAAKEERS